MKYEKMLYGPSGAPKEEDQSKDLKIAPVKATSSGTRFHNPPPPKFWYEAKNEDGQSYYWNTNTKESRWDPPHSGYVSIAEQEELQQKKDEKRMKKAQVDFLGLTVFCRFSCERLDRFRTKRFLDKGE